LAVSPRSARTGHEQTVLQRAETSWFVRRLRVALLAAAVLLSSSYALAQSSPPSIRPPEQRAVLTLIVNEVDKGDTLVLLKENDVWVRADALQQAGLRRFAGRYATIDGAVYVELSSLAPGIIFQLDERALAVRITADPEFLATLVLDVQTARPPGVAYSRSRSLFLNYAANYRNTGDYDLSGEAGLSMAGGLLTTTATRVNNGPVIRGLSSFVVDQRRHMTRWTFGDSYAQTGLLGGGLIVGGVSIARDWGLDPYYIRHATLALSGAVTTPSTVDIYVNDQLVRREVIPPGRFELARLPMPNGYGVARMVIRDAFGREQATSYPYYLTTSVLSRGDQDYGYTFGYQRNQMGTSNWDYSQAAFLGRHRVGITNWLTAGFRAEAARDLRSGGPTLNLRLPVGEVELAGALSSARGVRGSAVSLGYLFAARAVSAGLSATWLSRQYATLSLGAADRRSRLDSAAFASVRVGPRTSVTAQYSRQERYDIPWSDRATISSATRLSSRLSLFLSATRNRQPGAESNDLYAGLSVFLGRSTSATASYERRGDLEGRSVLVQRSLPVGSGYGYRAGLSDGDVRATDAALQYQGRYGRYEVSEQSVNGERTYSASVAGGLVLMGGGLYATRPVQESFALVRVPGVRGVRAYASNQVVGRTNGAGNVLVPNLLAYYGNILGIADEDVPFDYNVPSTRRLVGPPYRGGAVVTFPVTQVQSSNGIISVDAGGRTITPAYGRLVVTVGWQQFESPIGTHGEFYLENVPAGTHRATIEYEGGSCGFSLRIPKSTAPVIDLGTLRCTPPRGDTP